MRQVYTIKAFGYHPASQGRSMVDIAEGLR
jgi:hypothetical protein